MSLDLYEREVSARRESAPKTMMPEVGAWDGFARGTGMSAMQTFAKAGRGASMAAAVPFIAADAFTNGTEMQDRFFRSHDEIFGSAVEAWTPNADEVGVAGQITGQLLATIPMVIANPAGAVAATGLGTAEDLVRKGVDPTKATAVGVTQAAGLGLGIYVPVLGKTLAQRVLLGGAGFNVFQGAATRGASEAILTGTAAADDFKAFDPTALTLDVLLGSAFGTIAHLSPSARAEGAKFYERIDAWSKSLKPSDVDALLVMRQAQHANADSLPGKPTGPEDVTAHVARMKQAVDQLAKDKPVDVSNLPEGRFEADDARMQDNAKRSEELLIIADVVRRAERLPDFRKEIEAHLFRQKVALGEAQVKAAVAGIEAKASAEEVPGFLRKAEDLIALRGDQHGENLDPVVKEAIQIAKKPGFQRAAEERVRLEGILTGRLADYMQPRNTAERDLIGESVANVFARRAELSEDIRRSALVRKEALARGDESAAVEAKMNGDAAKQQRATLDAELIKRTEAPPAPRGAEPPPPRSDEGRPGGAEAKGEPPDPAVLEARRFVEERSDLEMTVGRDVDGKPIKMKLKKMLDESDAAVKLATDDAKLFEIAAACMLGGA